MSKIYAADIIYTYIRESLQLRDIYRHITDQMTGDIRCVIAIATRIERKQSLLQNLHRITGLNRPKKKNYSNFVI